MMDRALHQQQVYYARRELGLCTKCGEPVEKPDKYAMCSRCRGKARIRQMEPDKTAYRKEYMRQYREEIKTALHKISIAVQGLMEAQDLCVQRAEIPAAHKCWGCVWSKWHGDRFFCPLVGCVKEPIAEGEHGNEKETDRQ